MFKSICCFILCFLFFCFKSYGINKTTILSNNVKFNNGHESNSTYFLLPVNISNPCPETFVDLSASIVMDSTNNNQSA